MRCRAMRRQEVFEMVPIDLFSSLLTVIATFVGLLVACIPVLKKRKKAAASLKLLRARV